MSVSPASPDSQTNKRLKSYQDKVTELMKKHDLLTPKTKEDLNVTGNRIRTPYGWVNFKEFQRGRSTPSPFLTYQWNRAANEEADQQKEHYPGLVEILRYGWGLEEPKLILSVVGGLKKSPLTSRKTFISAFKRTIAQVATLEGVWILTLGTDKGTSELIGEAIAEHISAEGEDSRKSIYLIGLSRFENVNKIDPTTDPEYSEQDPRYPKMDPRNLENIPDNFTELTVKKSYWAKDSEYLPLEPNHTHFIFVDTSSNSPNSSTYMWKIKVEDQLSKKSLWENDGMSTRSAKSDQSGDSKPNTDQSGLTSTKTAKSKSDTIPRAYILLNGGKRSLHLVKYLLDEHHPLVVIKDSNRAADLIARLKLDPSGVLEMGDDKLMYDLDGSEKETKVSNASDKTISEILKSIHEKTKYITVWDFKDTKSEHAGLQRTILKALRDAEDVEKRSLEDEHTERWKCIVDLARAWDCIDDKLISEVVNSRNEERYSMKVFATALINGNDIFVDKMLDHLGDKITVYLQKFISKKHKSLYEEAVKCTDWSSEFMKVLLEKYRLNSTERTSDGGQCEKGKQKSEKEWIMGAGHRLSEFLGEEYMLPLQYLQDEQSRWCSSKVNQGDQQEGVSKNEKEEHIQYIFFWALLFNRYSTAKILLKYTKNPIVGALVGAAIFAQLEQKGDRRGVDEVTGIFHKHAVKFEEMACEMLSICWEKNKNLTYQMLITMMPEWGQKSPLVIAYNHDQQMFMAHSASFTALNRVWRGGVSVSTQSWRIVAFTIFPILVVLLKFDARILAEKDVEDLDNSGTKELHREIGVGWRTGSDTISFPKALYHGYNIPFVRFLWSLLWSILFLSVYCVFVLCELCDPSTVYNTTSDGLSPVKDYQYFNLTLYNQSDTWDFSYCHGIGIFELTTWCGIFALLLEEIFQFCIKKRSNNKRFTAALKTWYLGDLWNVLELLNFAVFGLAVGLRFLWTGEDFEWVRVAYTASLAGWFFRLFQSFHVLKSLGPKVTMIRNMVVDVAFFILILLIILFAFGVMFHGIINPQSRLTWKLFRDVLARPYWQMYGELFLDEVVFGEDSSLVTGGLLVIYMAFTNILLLNLLIAMFSHTFATVQEKAHILWRFNYYNLVDEYMERSYVPPLSIFFEILRTMCCQVRKKPFMRERSKAIVDRIQDLLLIAMHDYNTKTNSVVDLNETTVTTERRLGELLDGIHELQSQVSDVPRNSNTARPVTATVNQSTLTRNDLSTVVKQLQKNIDEAQKQTRDQITTLRNLLTSKLDTSLL